MWVVTKHSAEGVARLLLAALLLSTGLLARAAGEEGAGPRAAAAAAADQQTTAAPQPATGSPQTTTGAPAAEAASTTIVIETGAKSTSAPAASGAGSGSAAASASAATTQMPAATVEQLIRILTSEHADPSEPLHNFCDYIHPICATLEKLNDKCLGMTSGQLKKFALLSADGKLGQCFAESYSFDPSKGNVTKHDLSLVCASKDLAADVKGSYKSFQKCATKHWSANIDKEIDRIQVARLEYLRANHHLKDSTTSMLAQGDADDAKVVSEVVEKVLGSEPGKPAAANEVKVVSVDSTGHAKPSSVSTATSGSATTAAPAGSATVTVHHGAAPAGSAAHHAGAAAGAGSGSAKGHAAAAAAAAAAKQDKALMNDPNTLVVFVDELKGSTSKPEAAHHSASAKPGSLSVVKVITSSSSSTAKPAAEPSAAPTTTSAPANATSSSEPEAGSGSTAKPASESATTPEPEQASSTAAPATTAKPEEEAKSTTAKPPASTTASPGPAQKAAELLKKTLAEVGAGSLAKVLGSSTAAPAAKEKSPEERLEAKEVQLEGKLKEEREMMLKLLRKNQDELEALNAMRALSALRQKTVAQHDHSDERVHQLEHHRQMAMDPIGHMIKHQQYEVKKKLSGK